MALWRDPLDELISDLERALPPDARRGTLQLPPIEDVQTLVGALAFGTEEDRARAYKDPGVQRLCHGESSRVRQFDCGLPNRARGHGGSKAL
jgi:hypothetical protein